MVASAVEPRALREAVVSHFLGFSESAAGLLTEGEGGGAWLRPGEKWSRGAIAEVNRRYTQQAARL